MSPSTKQLTDLYTAMPNRTVGLNYPDVGRTNIPCKHLYAKVVTNAKTKICKRRINNA